MSCALTLTDCEDVIFLLILKSGFIVLKEYSQNSKKDDIKK